MRYVSTRGRAPVLDFEGVLLAGLASDGGLYVPERWPSLTREELASLRGREYADVAHAIISRFTGDTIESSTLRSIVGAAYAEFGHAAVAPLAQLGPSHWLLELFHGPTLAFKDVALQVLGRLYDHFLERHDTRTTIVGATSGDTGSAAIEAIRGPRAGDDLHPSPQGPRLRGPAPADDDGRRRATSTTSRWTAPSTTARRCSRRCSTTPPFAASSGSRG